MLKCTTSGGVHPMFPIIDLVAQGLVLLIVARAILSWLPITAPAPAPVRLVYQATDPILRPLQRVLPTLGGIDFSPFAAILLIQFAVRLLAAVFGLH
jgi:YggT family protein